MKMYLQETLHPYRENGTLVDFDGLAFGPNQYAVWAMLDDLDDAREDNPDFPEMGIESATFAAQLPPHSALATLSGLRVHKGQYFLTYRGIEKQIPPETMQPKYRSINGVEMPVFPAKTILHRYTLRGGVLKPKDQVKTKRLQAYIQEHEADELSDEYYQPYVEFAQQIQDRYKLLVGLYKLFWHMDSKLGGKISGAKGWVYKLIPHFTS